MPFKSKKQMKYLFANEPDVAKRWVKKYGKKTQKAKSLNDTIRKAKV